MDREKTWPITAGITRSHTESFLVYRNQHIYEDEWKKVSINSFLELIFLLKKHETFLAFPISCVFSNMVQQNSNEKPNLLENI